MVEFIVKMAVATACVFLVIFLTNGDPGWIKTRLCDLGGLFLDIIGALGKYRRQKKLIKQAEREWEQYLENNRGKIIEDLMAEQQRYFLGERKASEKQESDLKEFPEPQFEKMPQNQGKQEEETWENHIMKRFMKKM